MSEAPGIPTPPRAVRVRACLQRWWPFGLTVTVGLLVCTIIIAARLWIEGGALPFQDLSLDSGASTASARIERSEPSLLNPDLRFVHYRFDCGARGEKLGTCWVREKYGRVGRRAGVQFLHDDPDISRLIGGKRALSTFWLPSLFAYLWAPLFLLFLVWVRAVFAVRLLARNGASYPARPTTVRGGGLPGLRLVRYVYDNGDGDRQGWRLVSAGSAIVPRLQAGEPGVAVICKPSRPELHRLMAAEDFARGATGECRT